MATKAVMLGEVQKYRVKISFLTPLLGTAPSDPNLYKDYLISKALDEELKKARTEEDKARIEKLRAARTDHELTLLPGAANSSLLVGSPASVIDALTPKTATADDAEETKGKTIFRANKSGLILPGYMVKGYYKEAAKAMADFAQPASKIDKWLYIAESEIPLMRDGAQLQRESTYEWARPLRTAEDKFGVSRVCIAVSEVIAPPCELEFTVLVLPKGFVNKGDSGKFGQEDIKKWTEYGAFTGLGQWRNANNGAFEIRSFVEEPVAWNDALNLRIAALKSGRGTWVETEEEPVIDGKE